MSFPAELLTPSWFVAGPTAVGKTAVSLLLAQRLNAEIISLDSMAVYRGMDVGTAKPGAKERQQVVHHLIDIADPGEEFSVAEFMDHAQAAAREIIDRSHVPLFVGGTGLYLRSILRGIHSGPPPDWNLRRRLQAQAAAEGPESLHGELKRLDPVTAARLHPHDVRRVIRAIEVCERTGTALSDSQTHGPRPDDEQPRRVVWLEPPRDWLRARIEQRVDQMMQDGLLQETQQLLDRQPPVSRTARQALGYRELIDHLEGRCSLDEAVARIKTATRQFAKRQHTWFRNLPECDAVPITGSESPAQLSDIILADARIGK